MQFLIIQITDVHIKEDTSISGKKIENIANLISQTNLDNILLIFSGDIVFSGSKKEFCSAEDFILKLIVKIEDQQNKNINVLPILVPGNHDITYPPEFDRIREDVSKISSKNYFERLPDELDLFKNFYEFEREFIDKSKFISRTNKDSVDGKILCEYNVNICDKSNINILTLNNSLYSFFSLKKTEFYDNEKGQLTFPDLSLSLQNQKDDFVNILVMHFPMDFYSDESREKFIKEVSGKIHLVFFGHSHFDLSKKMLDIKEGPIFFSCKEFNQEKSQVCQFNMLEVSSESKSVKKRTYTWDNKKGCFVHENNEITIELPSLDPSPINIQKNEDFLNELYEDDNGISEKITDYFVFPNMGINTKSNSEGPDRERISSVKAFKTLVEETTTVIISGDDTSGKTSIMKYLHYEYGKSKLVLFTNYEKLNSKKNRNNQLLKELFKEQYEVASFDEFAKINIRDRIIIIDDFQLVAEKVYWLNEFKKNFKMTILSYSKPMVTNPIEKDEIEEIIEGDYKSFKIDNFYKTKRDELVFKLYKVLSDKKNSEINDTQKEKFLKKFSSVLENNMSLFSLNPHMLILLAKHLFNTSSEDDKNVFNDVFTFNLTQQINISAKKKRMQRIEPYTYILQKYAYRMITKQNNFLELSDIDEIVKKYNNEHGLAVEVTQFLDLLKDAKILKEENNRFYFASKNYLAYFASKEFVRLSHSYDDHKEEFEFLMNNLFLGVNDKILLFIAFSQQNEKIIYSIIEKVGFLVAENEEIDLDCFKFLKDSKVSIDSLQLSTNETRERKKNEQDKSEKRLVIKEHRTKFDVFTKSDFTCREKKIIGGIKYLNLVANILPVFIHTLNVDMQKKIVTILYKLPNILIFYQLKELDTNRNKLIEDLYFRLTKEQDIKDEDIVPIKDELYQILVDVVRAIILSIYDSVARRSVDSLTGKTLDEYTDVKTTNTYIQRLMFASFLSGKRHENYFRKMAIDVHEQAIKDNNTLLKNCVMLIVRRFAYDSEDISFHGEDKKFLRVFFNEASIKDIMVQRQAEK